MAALFDKVPPIVWFLLAGFIIFIFVNSMVRSAKDHPNFLTPPSFDPYGHDGPDFSGLTFEDIREADELASKGIQLAKQGHVKESEQAFRSAIAIAPKLPNYRISLSNVLLMQNRVSEAEHELMLALEQGPIPRDAQAAYVNLAGVCNEQMRYHEALEWLQRAEAVFTTDNEVYFNMGVCHERLGDWEEAKNAFLSSNELEPNDRAQMSAVRMENRAWRSPDAERIRSEYSGFSKTSPICKIDDSLTDRFALPVAADEPLAFLVGAGISYPYPASLPLAGTILREIFHFFYALDKDDICSNFGWDMTTLEDEAYSKLSHDFLVLLRDFV
jgi:tetratricopeptide (TPR) repeat protein